MFCPKVTRWFVVSGPGCSSVGYGATQEIGPFLVDNNNDGQGLKFNNFSWNKGICYIIYIYANFISFHSQLHFFIYLCIKQNIFGEPQLVLQY